VILATGKYCAPPLVNWQAAIDDNAAPSAGPPKVYYEKVVVGKGDVHDPVTWLQTKGYKILKNDGDGGISNSHAA
jgi:hypothetical protein